jgi:hypothetical protein
VEEAVVMADAAAAAVQSGVKKLRAGQKQQSSGMAEGKRKRQRERNRQIGYQVKVWLRTCMYWLLCSLSAGMRVLSVRVGTTSFRIFSFAFSPTLKCLKVCLCFEFL